MKWSGLSSSLAVCFFALGCSNTTPQIGMLASVSGGMDFTPALITTSSWSSVGISAKCPSFVDSVQVSFDNGQTWTSAQALDPSSSGNCSSGTFSMTLTNTKSPLSSFSFVSGQITNVQFQTHTKFNTTSVSLLQIQYVPASQKKQELLVGLGTQEDTAHTMILSSRVRMQKQVSASGGNYQLRGWVQ